MHRNLVSRAVLGVVAALGAGTLLLVPASALGAFPGANGKIAYAHQVQMSSSSIYAVSRDGRSPTNLSAVGTGTDMNADFQPAWSVNGRRLAFVRVDFKNCSGQIWTMRADGTDQENRSKNGALANEFNPSYGPDGSIVFVRAPAHTFNICTKTSVSQGDLWVRGPHGTTRQLTSDGLDNTPAWSPDGKKIAFTRVSPGAPGKPPSGPPHVFVMNANGTGMPKDLGPGVKPNWSPDGKKIVFAAPGVPGQATGGPVTVMNADGSHRRVLNKNGTAPAWSPDGTKIVYLSFPSPHTTALGVMDADGHHQHSLIGPGPGNSDVKPDWQPVLRRLRLSVSPRRATAGRRTCFSLRTRSGGRPVAGVSIRFAHQSRVSSASGRARICVSLSTGVHRARANKPGYLNAIARVRAHHHRGFTG